MKQSIILTLAILASFASPRNCVAEANPSLSQLKEVLRRLSGSVVYGGYSVKITDRSKFIDHADVSVDLVDKICLTPGFENNSGNLFAAALAYRVLYGGADDANRSRVTKRCEKGLAEIRGRFEARFKRKHPGIEELALQMAKDIPEEKCKKIRVEAALAGCRTSAKRINADCSRSDIAFDQYFGSSKEAYIFSLVDMLYSANSGEDFDFNADHLIPLYIRFHKDDVVLSNVLFDEDIEHNRVLFNVCMQAAWHNWNRRYKGQFDFELDLADAWSVLTSANGASEGERKDRGQP